MLEALTGIAMPEPLRLVLSRDAIHRETVERTDMIDSVRSFIGKLP